MINRIVATIGEPSLFNEIRIRQQAIANRTNEKRNRQRIFVVIWHELIEVDRWWSEGMKTIIENLFASTSSKNQKW